MPAASALVPLWDRASEWQRRLAMVRDARHFLYLTTFYIEYDAYGAGMLDALINARRRGVAVQLVIDAFGQRLGGVLMTASERAALAGRLGALRNAGGDVMFYRPPRVAQRLLGGGQHVKIQVSDAGEAIFGSSNLTRSSFEGWNEFSVAVRGSVVRALLESVSALGGAARAEDLARLGSLEEPGDTPCDYWFCNPNDGQGLWGPLGWRGTNAITDGLCQVIDRATREVRLTSFYFKPVGPLMDAVLRAARRGVHVEIHHSHRDALPATDLAWIAAAAGYVPLLDAGVDIYENQRGEHSKIVVIDDAWTAFGSYNFEDAAHDRLAEAMIVTHDSRAVAMARGLLDGLRAQPHNVRVTQDTFGALPDRLRRRVRWLGRFKRWM